MRAEVTLAGFNLLRFAPDGRCIELREYWAMDEGFQSPPPGVGPLKARGATSAASGAGGKVFSPPSMWVVKGGGREIGFPRRAIGGGPGAAP